MSIAQSFLPSETEEVLHPQFSRALKGFNPAEVDSYVEQAARRIEVLEEHLEKTLEERDHLRRELASVKTDVYRNAGERLAGILRGIDDHVEGVRRKAEEEAAHHVKDAERQAEQLHHSAIEEEVRARGEAARIIQDAEEEAARVLGELTDRRNAVQAEIEGLRGVLLALLDRLDVPSQETGTSAASTDVAETRDEAAAEEAESATPQLVRIGAVEEPELTDPGEDDDDDATWIADIDKAVVDLRDLNGDEEPPALG